MTLYSRASVGPRHPPLGGWPVSPLKFLSSFEDSGGRVIVLPRHGGPHPLQIFVLVVAQAASGNNPGRSLLFLQVPCFFSFHGKSRTRPFSKVPDSCEEKCPSVAIFCLPRRPGKLFACRLEFWRRRPVFPS